jgi:hypothetical protein
MRRISGRCQRGIRYALWALGEASTREITEWCYPCDNLPFSQRSPRPSSSRTLLFSPPPSAALVQPTDEPADHEHGRQESDDHAHADKHIGEDNSGAVLDGHGRLSFLMIVHFMQVALTKAASTLAQVELLMVAINGGSDGLLTTTVAPRCRVSL